MRPRHQPALTVRLAVLRTLAVLDVELNSLRRDAPVRAHVHPTHEPGAERHVPRAAPAPTPRASGAAPPRTRDVTPLGGAGTPVTHIVW